MIYYVVLTIIASCLPGDFSCSGNCVNLQTDVTNCGSCGQICTSPANGTPFCQEGTCGISCPAMSTLCPGNCANLSSDVNNCGGCGRVCSFGPNSSPTCSSGICGLTCSPPFVDCDGNPSNGCEVNILTSPSNCGGCQQTCPSGQNGSPVCKSGTCGLFCPFPFANCNGNPNSGCQVNLAIDPHNCGACGAACPANLPNGSPGCFNLMCGVQCAAGFANCDAVLSNGCETPIVADVHNCGGCGITCPPGINGVAICSSSACGITCSTGFANCNGNLADGCEINTNNDVNNCGACGNVCSSVNGSPSCTIGNCGIVCNTGFGNCNNNATDGCETNLSTDILNCGSCGNAVSTLLLCSSLVFLKAAWLTL
jgi:hypothetical protein